jgi:hypothetical protein
LYIQDYDDSVALSSLNEVESLTTGLSRKIWQKPIILYEMPESLNESGAAAPKHKEDQQVPDQLSTGPSSEPSG